MCCVAHRDCQYWQHKLHTDRTKPIVTPYFCYSRGSHYSHHSQAPSHYSYRSGQPPSEVSTVKTKTSRKGGLVVETMAAPNPFCPNTKGICCLMLLINLGLILVTLGFVVVIQFFEPLFVWYVSTFSEVHTYH
jgi:hypothetical protein